VYRSVVAIDDDGEQNPEGLPVLECGVCDAPKGESCDDNSDEEPERDAPVDLPVGCIQASLSV
jgi:hypothetical protein